jgi:hypothetical protein
MVAVITATVPKRMCTAHSYVRLCSEALSSGLVEGLKLRPVEGERRRGTFMVAGITPTVLKLMSTA